MFAKIKYIPVYVSGGTCVCVCPQTGPSKVTTHSLQAYVCNTNPVLRKLYSFPIPTYSILWTSLPELVKSSGDDTDAQEPQISRTCVDIPLGHFDTVL